VPSDKTRTLAEIPWLSLLPPEQRAGVEEAHDDPDGAEWDVLVAADRALEDDFAGPSSFSRVLKPLVAAGALAAMLLAFDAPSVAEQRTGGGGSNASASGTVTATPVGAATVPEENRAVLAARSSVAVAGTTNSGTKNRKPRAPRGGAPGAPSTPPPAADEPAPLASATLPVVGEVKVPAPRVEVTGVELPQLPQLPPLQLPQLPQLPPLLPPSQQ
jgi:hypothetical protein